MIIQQFPPDPPETLQEKIQKSLRRTFRILQGKSPWRELLVHHGNFKKKINLMISLFYKSPNIKLEFWLLWLYFALLLLKEKDVDGILGYPFFAKRPILIDFPNQKVFFPQALDYQLYISGLSYTATNRETGGFTDFN